MLFVFASAEPIRAGDFVLCTTSLRGWTSAILGVLHDTLQKRKWFTDAILNAGDFRKFCKTAIDSSGHYAIL